MAPITRQREDCALSDEVCRGVVLVQLRKEDEVRVLGEKGHLSHRDDQHSVRTPRPVPGWRGDRRLLRERC
jgi:hypothetical protein